MNTKSIVLLSALCAVSAASAEMMDRPSGIKIGQRMTLRPYVGISGSYDSNVSGANEGAEDVVWLINPGLGLEYKAENWSVLASAYYQYNFYTKKKNINRNTHHTFGEMLTFNWTDSQPGERGWSVMITEQYRQLNAVDDLSDVNGNSYNRDRRELTSGLGVQRRFGEGFHADVNGGYYWLDYPQKSNGNTSSGLYGWSRWSGGAEVGYAPTKWTDILLCGNYSGYRQDNGKDLVLNARYPWSGSSRESDSYTVHAGLGSFATDKITYRVLGGWTYYKYGSSDNASSGFTYSLSGNWKISDTWHMMWLANSAYQPSEREFGSSHRVDSVSWGVGHAMVQGKLNGTFDIAYRRESREHEGVTSYDYDLDIATFRLGFNYTLNRYLSLFTNFEYRMSRPSDSSTSSNGHGYDYDRFRGTLGVRLTY